MIQLLQSIFTKSKVKNIPAVISLFKKDSNDDSDVRVEQDKKNRINIDSQEPMKKTKGSTVDKERKESGPKLYIDIVQQGHVSSLGSVLLSVTLAKLSC
jgi:hypothetical protein